MNKRKNTGLLCAGILVGTMLAGPAAHAVSNVLAERATQPIYVDGKQVALEAYAIGGHNYVQLRDIGKAAGFNVTWDDATQSVQIDTQSPYQEEATSTANPSGTIRLPTDGSRYIPQAGDVIRCDDGSDYAITDVIRYDKNMFASGPVGGLPTPTCDWSSFPEVPLPPPETRRYHLDSGDYLFARNLYESRRMQYTIQNLAGNHPETSENGALRYGPDGTPYVRIQLTLDEHMSPQVFRPWRESELERIFNSVPPGTYAMEVWDVFKDGVFQRTEYNIYAL